MGMNMQLKTPSLQQALAEAELNEFRHLQGRRYELQPVLLLSCAAMMSGARSEQQIADWCSDEGTQWRSWLGMSRERSPSADTISRIFRGIDGARMEAAVLLWTEQIKASLQPIDRERWSQLRLEQKISHIDHSPRQSLWMERKELMSALSEELGSLVDRLMGLFDDQGIDDGERMRNSMIADLVLFGLIEARDARKPRQEDVIPIRRLPTEPAIPAALGAPEYRRRPSAY
jgi:hypothetical protein